jgi:predicted nucleotidyltransferase
VDRGLWYCRRVSFVIAIALPRYDVIERSSMTLEELRRTRRSQILQLAAIHGAHNVRIFGSAARGDASPASDVDFLVDLDPNRTLMDLGGLLMDLQELLQVRVDVATEGMLRPKVRDRALADAIPL